MSVYDATQNVSYASLSAAITGSNAGDVIEISAGTYSGNLPSVTHDLTIEAIGGMATLTPPAGQSPANGKAILVTDANVTLDNLAFTGATVPDGNGAGVRMESGNLTVNNCWFYNNQDGLLTSSPLPGAVLTINNSEFSNNGSGTGYTHNLYVGQIAQVSINNSYFTAANAGHEIKSRAAVTDITNSRIQDGPSADTSYSIDLPNGGIANISNNVIEKGPHAQNHAFIAYGEETTAVPANSSVTISDNTVIDNLPAAEYGPFIWDVSPSISTGTLVLPSVTDNIFYGVTAAQLVAGPGFFDSLDGTPYLADNSFQPIAAAPPLDTSQPFAAPEPAVAPLLMLALSVVATIRRRRRSTRPARVTPRFFGYSGPR